ncbi:uncharacterized protein [Watersipora subatra]|uniref:uncharacterized protein n=1 Tax=Watersipora subatra TaxID=2589382 RepID=UPI00355C340F
MPYKPHPPPSKSTKSTTEDTWKKITTSTVSLEAPSTKSTVPGDVSIASSVKFSLLTFITNVQRRSRPVQPVKPLGSSKLRPLQPNNGKREDNSNLNTWDPKNRPNVPVLKKPAVSVNAAKAKLNGPVSRGGATNSQQGTVTPPSRSSSVASNKPVLPGIKSKSSNLSESEYGEKSSTVTNSMVPPSPVKPEDNEKPSASRQESRPLTSRKRDLDAAQAKRATFLEQPDETINYFIPEWYKNPLVKPEPMKGGITVFLCGHGMKHPKTESVNFINLLHLWHLKDVKELMVEQQNNSLLTVYCFNCEKDEESEDNNKTTESVPPPVLIKEHALKANDLFGGKMYEPSRHDTDIYNLAAEFEHSSKEKSILEEFVTHFREYCQKLADSLGIKSVKSTTDLEGVIVKAQKRRVNIQKQERALLPNVYLEPFESEDIWNHVNTSHSLSDSAFKRESLLQEVKSAINSSIKTTSSPIVVSGGQRTGKTWLCAQLPSEMADETLTLVRFCGLTSLTTTLPRVLLSLSKQLTAIYRIPLLSHDITNKSISKMAESFKSLLDELSASVTKPVVLVLDGFDKLAASNMELCEFISFCKEKIPSNIALLLSVTSREDDSEFLHISIDCTAQTIIKKLDYISDLRQFTDSYSGVVHALKSMIIPVAEEHGSDMNLDATFLQESLASVEDALSKAATEETSEGLFKYLKIASDHLSSMVNLIDAANITGIPKDSQAEVEEIRHSIKGMMQKRESMKELLELMMQTVDKFKHEDLKYLDTVEEGLDSSERIRVSDLSGEEARLFVKHLCAGNFEEAEASKLEEAADYLNNPLLLRLVVNRCALGLPADKILAVLKETRVTDPSVVQQAVEQALGEAYQSTEEYNLVWNSKALRHLSVTMIIFYQDGDSSLGPSWAPYDGREPLPDLSALMLTDSARQKIHRNTQMSGVQSNNAGTDSYMYYLSRVMNCCTLSVYEQGDFVCDIERVESLIRSELFQGLITPSVPVFSVCTSDLKEALSIAAKQVCQTNIELCGMLWDSDVFTALQEMIEGMMNKVVGLMCTEEWERESLEDFKQCKTWLKVFADFNQVSTEVDKWQDIIEYSETGEAKISGSKEAHPVTSAKEKDLPLGRDKIAALNICRHLLLEFVYSENIKWDDEETPIIHGVIEFILQYDFLVPLFQEFGVDYVKDAYGDILEVIRNWLAIQKAVIQNLLPLEMIYNMLTTYTSQLRETPGNFNTLFLSMFNEDSSLTSQAAMRLYKRINHEVGIKNNLHLVTILSKTGDGSLLSSDAKRYLQNTSEKYAASECISNKSYILSHNKNNLVKLWELTGEFIGAQKLDGRIVCVCPQRSHACFLAVIETESEVGEKFASVWRIDKLAHTKVVDIGFRTILAAWFDNKGEKLVLAEQCTVDEMRVVVCQPQTIQVKINDRSIHVLPFKPTTFLDKSIVVPQRIDQQLLELMTKHMSGDKEAPDPTELSFYKPTKDGGAELSTIATRKPLIFASLKALWDDMLDKFDAKDDVEYPMKETCSNNFEWKEHIAKLKINLLGMTSTGDILVSCKYSDATHKVLCYKMENGAIELDNDIEMDERATMTLMPTDDFVYSDTGSHSGLISWHLPTNATKIFGNEQKVHVTCLQFEVEEGQILSFTRGQVTVWNALKKTTESSFTLDKYADIVAASLQDNWLAIANRDGELAIRFEIRKKMATYHFHEPIDWIDCHVIKDHLYVACHINGVKPSICFLKYQVNDASLHEPGKYVVRKE